MERAVTEVFPPGEYIKDELVARGWSQRDLAEILGRSEPKVSEIVNGKRALTARTAKELGAAFGTSAQVWLNLDVRWQLWRDGSSVDEIAVRGRRMSMKDCEEARPRRFLPGVPGPHIEAVFNAAPGNEIASGKFDSPQSSAALAANAFGFFLNGPEKLPPLPGCECVSCPTTSLELQKAVRFPWRGGRHPVLDVLVTTPTALIGIESKRFEPFRTPGKIKPISGAYWRPCWGDNMKGYERVRDMLHKDKGKPARLDAAQLFKHAFALRTEVHRDGPLKGLKPILFYIYAEPESWPRDDGPVSQDAIAEHRSELDAFAGMVTDDEVEFVSCAYRALLEDWKQNDYPDIRGHADAIIRCFAP